MNRNLSKLFAIFGLGLAAFGLLGRTDSIGSSIEGENVLVMGLSADNPPFEFKRNGDVVGFDIDLAREVARLLGYSLSIQDMDFTVLIPSLHSGRIDFAMSGMTVTDIRKQNVDFSDVYFTSTFALVTANNAEFSQEEDLKGKKIGVQLGTTMEKFAKEKAKDYPGMEIVPLGKNSILIQELKSDRLFGLLTEEAQAQEFAKMNPTLKSHTLASSEDGYAVAFSRNAKFTKVPQLREKFNSAFKTLKANGKLEKLKQKWLDK